MTPRVHDLIPLRNWFLQALLGRDAVAGSTQFSVRIGLGVPIAGGSDLRFESLPTGDWRFSEPADHPDYEPLVIDGTAWSTTIDDDSNRAIARIRGRWTLRRPWADLLAAIAADYGRVPACLFLTNEPGPRIVYATAPVVGPGSASTIDVEFVHHLNFGSPYRGQWTTPEGAPILYREDWLDLDVLTAFSADRDKTWRPNGFTLRVEPSGVEVVAGGSQFGLYTTASAGAYTLAATNVEPLRYDTRGCSADRAVRRATWYAGGDPGADKPLCRVEWAEGVAWPTSAFGPPNLCAGTCDPAKVETEGVVLPGWGASLIPSIG